VRGFLTGRTALAKMNSLLIISGAFGLFRKEAVIASGGYLHNTIGEDMELVVRMHRMLRDPGVDYRVEFVPEPVFLAEAPEDMKTLCERRSPRAR